MAKATEKQKENMRKYHIRNRNKIRERKQKWYANNRGSHQPMSQCIDEGIYLGVHVAEQVLQKVFKNVKMMPINNPGYDFICNHGKKIDVKSSCLIAGSEYKGNIYKHWCFNPKRNVTADYFLCLGFDNRQSLNPLHLWLIPGNILNKQLTASISESTLHKWNKYELNKLDKVVSCCNKFKKEMILQ